MGWTPWRENPYYNDRERAALQWTGAVTLIREGHVPDEVYDQVRPRFSEKETGRPDVRRGHYQRLGTSGNFLTGAGGRV
jgi:hypothetical protein